MLTMANNKFNSLINRKFLYETLGNKTLENLIKKSNISHKPFITVSREPGSGGKLIGRRLAEHLKFKFYYKEIIDRMFKNRELANECLEHYDEKELSFIDNFIASIIHPNLITQDRFVKELTQFITKLTLAGSCVILGRGANFFTDHRFGFHVRLTAPLEFRVEKTVRFEHLSLAKATKKVIEVSEERKKFVEKYFSRHIDNSEYYDLVLNREYYSIEEAMEIIINAFKKKMKR